MSFPSDDMIDNFNSRYRASAEPVIRRIEQQVIGSDYGSTSYTTIAQANLLRDILDLGPEKRLLDIGTGAGWPGIYLAQSSECDVVLSDVPFEGLDVARSRAQTEKTNGSVVASSGAPLPFRDSSFEAVTSSDVFC